VASSLRISLIYYYQSIFDCSLTFVANKALSFTNCQFVTCTANEFSFMWCQFYLASNSTATAGLSAVTYWCIQKKQYSPASSSTVFIAAFQQLTARSRCRLADETVYKLMFLRSVFKSGNDYYDFSNGKGSLGLFDCLRTVMTVS